MIQFNFWYSEDYGIIRQRRTPGLLWHPEVWDDGRWWVGSAYVMDAITGMGEDPWSCGELLAESWSIEQAHAFAQVHNIDLYADNPDQPHL